MEIRTREGLEFNLSLAGYQFPALREDHDSNWLNVHMAVKLPRGAWSVTDPFLMVEDVERLAKWFGAIGASNRAKDVIGFTEPNLWFELVQNEAKSATLRVHFEQECLPPWAETGEAIFADFPLAEIDLSAAAESLKSELRHYR